MKDNGDLTVHDLPMSERLRAQLPALAAILAVLALCLFAYGWWQQGQRDADRRAFERTTKLQAQKLASTQRTAITAQRRAEEARHLSDARFAFSFNKLACTLRTVADQSINRLEQTKTPGYKEAERFWIKLRDNNVPIPDKPATCKSLPDHPPPDTAPPG